MPSKIINIDSKDLMQRLEDLASVDRKILFEKVSDNRFWLRSHASYEGSSMIEKPHYRVSGSIHSQSEGSEVRYQIRPNQTFIILTVTLPLLMLPGVFLNLEPQNSFGAISALYLLALVLVMVVCIGQSYRLKRKGTSDFNDFLDTINADK